MLTSQAEILGRLTIFPGVNSYDRFKPSAQNYSLTSVYPILRWEYDL